jgi:hypothetical protein
MDTKTAVFADARRQSGWLPAEPGLVALWIGAWLPAVGVLATMLCLEAEDGWGPESPGQAPGLWGVSESPEHRLTHWVNVLNLGGNSVIWGWLLFCSASVENAGLRIGLTH